jgi:beta-lactamase class A
MALALLAAASLVAGCGASASALPPTAPTPTPTPTSAPTPAPPGTNSPAPTAAETIPVALPSTPVGTRLAWVVGILNGTAARPTAAEISAAFAPSFMAQVSVDKLATGLEQVAGAGPFIVASYTPTADGLGAVARLDGTVMSLTAAIAAEATPPNRIASLVFKPATDVPSPSPAASWEEIDTTLRGMVSEPSILAAEITGGRCVPIHALDADRSLAIASAFKLYVLGELARQVAAGKASWDEQLAVRDDWKSPGGGNMEMEAAGTRHTLAEFARLMISISDNTATDHLLHRLGRQSVEANLPAMGLTDPTRMQPFLMTREMSVLKVTRYAALTTAWLAADTAGRRALLEGPVAVASVVAADYADVTAPREVDTIEWFASTNDLCAAMARLRDLGGRAGLAPVLDILAVNPGVQIDKARWPYVGYKGGSEPGVLQMTWLLRRSDDRWFVLSLTADDPVSAKDHALAVAGLAQSALHFLETAP